MRIQNTRLLLMSAFAACSGFMGIFNAHIAIFISLKGYSHFLIGLLVGAINISGMIGPLVISNFLTKTQNYRLVYIIIAIGSSLMILGLVFFQFIWLSFILVFVYGFLVSSFGSTMEATFVNFLYNPYKEYGIVRSIASLGYVLVALAIAFFPIVDLTSIVSVAFFGVIGFMVLVIATLSFIPKRENDEDNYLDNEETDTFLETVLRMKKAFFLLLILVFFNFLGVRAIDTYLGLQAKEVYGMQSITIFFVISAGFEIIAIYFGQRIVEKFGYIISWFIVLLATATRLWGLGLIESKWVLFATQPLHIASFGLMISTVIHFVNHSMKKENRSIAMGLYQVIMSLATILGVVVGGGILNTYSYSRMFLTMSFAPIIGIIFLICVIPYLKLSAVYKVKDMK